MESRLRSALMGAALLALWSPMPSSAVQDEPNGTLRVFLDCRFCDDDHFRREIAFVDYVRDRQDADVHVLGTSQGTGAGREYTFEFIGLGQFQGRADTLVYNSSRTNTNDEARDGQVRIFAIGILRYVAETTSADDIGLSFRMAEERATAAQSTDDPWNFWVFGLGGNGSYFAESTQKRYSVGGSVNANRTTEDWKIEMFGFADYDRREDELTDSTFVSSSVEYATEGLIVRSAGQHWGVGAGVEVSASTFQNRRLLASAVAALEYSVFPYAQSTRRQLVALYTIGVSHFDWEEITIFDRLSETRLTQSLELAYRVVQPWGNLSAGLEGRSFLHDLSLHSTEANVGFNIRLIRGLRFNGNGFVARIKDQIFLPREGITDEEILVQRRQQGTDFRIRLRFGFNYTFGSIFNNVVNPRLNRL